MIFPRNTVKVGDCIAVVHHYTREPMTGDRYTGTTFDGEFWSSHRLSYHLNIQPIPVRPPSRMEGHILHSCDNKWCVNPDHLSLGTASQNAKDNAKRNKNWKESVTKHLKQYNTNRRGESKPAQSKALMGRKRPDHSKRMKEIWAQRRRK